METKQRKNLIVGAVLGVVLVAAAVGTTTIVAKSNAETENEIFMRVASIPMTPDGLGQMTDDPVLQRSHRFWAQYRSIDFDDNIEVVFLSEPRFAMVFEKGVANMSGKGLAQTLQFFEDRVLGFSDSQVVMLALNAGVLPKDYTPPVISVPTEFKDAYKECLSELTERYSDNNDGKLTASESLFEFMRPQCDDLQSMASNFSSYLK